MTRPPEIPRTIIDGREVPPLYVDESLVMAGNNQGAVVVRQGTLEVSGRLNGSVHLGPGTAVIVRGQISGSISVGGGALAQIFGILSGSVSITRGGRLVIEEGGRLSGSFHNDGSVLLRGEFGGSTSGSGDFTLEGSGRVQQPRVVDGVKYYEW